MTTALQMVALAAVKVGLAEVVDASYEGAVEVDSGGTSRHIKLPSPVRVFGMDALNRVYRWVWFQFPYREQRVIDLSVPILATNSIVSFPNELDVIRSVWAIDRAVLPIGEVTETRQGEYWKNIPQGSPVRYVSLPDGTDENEKTVRRIKIIPPAKEDMTLHVNGLRRFVEMGEGDVPILERCVNAVFDYLAGELFEYDDQQERADKERTKASDELKAAISWQEVIEDTDEQALPLQSFYEE